MLQRAHDLENTYNLLQNKCKMCSDKEFIKFILITFVRIFNTHMEFRELIDNRIVIFTLGVSNMKKVVWSDRFLYIIRKFSNVDYIAIHYIHYSGCAFKVDATQHTSHIFLITGLHFLEILNSMEDNSICIIDNEAEEKCIFL